MECYACANEATRQCRRCARVYCEVHGGDVCGECLSPTSTLPSFNLYRGSLLALLVGTAVALWLLVRPPGSGEVAPTLFDTTPIVTEVSTTTTPRPTDVSETATPRTRTPPAGETRTPTRTPLSSDVCDSDEYEVLEGDTLTGIAEQFAPPGVDAFTYSSQIAFANSQSVEDLENIQPGECLLLP